MSSPEFHEQFSQALRAEGVTARGVRRLSAEYHDHYLCGVETRVGQGMASVEAAAASAQALGDPLYLAAAAAERWRTRLWRNRHPWLFGLAMGLGGWLLAFALLLLAVESAALFKGEAKWVPPDSFLVTVIQTLAALANWLPAGIGGLWLGWEFRRRRLLGRAFWIGCLGVAIGTSLLFGKVTPPTLQHHGSLEIILSPVAGILLWPWAFLLRFDREWGYRGWHSVFSSANTIPMALQVLLALVLAWVAASGRFRRKPNLA